MACANQLRNDRRTDPTRSTGDENTHDKLLLMSRWEPDAAGRLARAALALYAERGFDQTTVAEIAKRAGLTERTFFRYFVDKRDVLFAGTASLQEALVGAVASGPDSSAPIDAVGTALESAGRFFNEERR